MNWNLDDLYLGFDDKYQADLKKMDGLMENYIKHIEGPKKDDISYIEGYLTLSEEMTKLVRTLASYASLRMSTDVTNQEALVYMSKIQHIGRKATAQNVLFTRYLKTIDLDKLAKQSKLINHYLFNLKKEQEEAQYLLSEKEEVLYSKLSELGSSSWGQLQSVLTSNVNVNYRDQVITLSEVRNLAYEKDASVRKDAYDAELKAYEVIEDAVSLALSNIKREVTTMNEIRGYASALDKTLIQSNMTKKTLDAMLNAMKAYRPHFASYLKEKAIYLGHQGSLPFYELFAPVGKLEKTYTYDEASELVKEGFYSYSNRLGDFAKKAFDQHWIDPFPKKGKRGGAFCSNQPQIKQSRILSNFTGSLSDCLTLAHELGHGYHGEVISSNSPLHWSYPMPLAETASIFCETIMNNHMLKTFTKPEERLSILENSLQGDTQVIIDILSRYFFETAVFEKANGPISKHQMKDMMLQAQKDAYLDGLDHEVLHPYMWLSKGHYYSARLNFYNFPYAFGLLFGKGLYAQYLKNPEGFKAKYDDLLQMTTKADIVTVAKTMDINVEDESFWMDSLEMVKKDIDEVISLFKTVS